MFEGEALGLRLMYETNTIRVPKPFKVGGVRKFCQITNWCCLLSFEHSQRISAYTHHKLQVGSLRGGGSFIIMEFIEFGASRNGQVRLPLLEISLIVENSCIIDQSILSCLNLCIFRLLWGGSWQKCIKQENLIKALVLKLITPLAGTFFVNYE